jgi:hypothetical protein
MKSFVDSVQETKANCYSLIIMELSKLWSDIPQNKNFLFFYLWEAE